MEKFVKEVSPLRMKNAVLHNTQQKLKKRIKDMEEMSHMEHMITWDADKVKGASAMQGKISFDHKRCVYRVDSETMFACQRSQALISLLEDDGIVAGLPDNFLEHCKWAP